MLTESRPGVLYTKVWLCVANFPYFPVVVAFRHVALSHPWPDRHAAADRSTLNPPDKALFNPNCLTLPTKCPDSADGQNPA